MDAREADPAAPRHRDRAAGPDETTGTATTSITATRTPPSAPPRAAGATRRDIQVLRAVAVAAVVVFHLWPAALPGGYVGVDVFFVVSGFLITSHLLRTPPTSLRALAAFWARRVRRLLPAASTVLVVTTLAAIALLPAGMLARTGREVLASTLLVENWSLANQATDYLAADASPTPVQHFWSLGVEEQFYLAWPLLLAATLLAVRLVGPARRHPRRAVGLVVGVSLLASLAWSVHLTFADPARAYFVTPTRVWELALGAVLAAVGARTVGWARGRSVVGWLGLAAIAAAAVTFDSGTPFPGAAALLPTLGAAAVVWSATDDTPGGPGRLLARRPVVWVGDVSYGIYLWHWPLLVLAPFALGAVLGTPARLALVASTLLLAAATTRWIEDPLRDSVQLRRSSPRTFALGGATAVVCVALAFTATGIGTARASDERRDLAVAVAGDLPCFGAAATRDPSCGDPAGEAVIGGASAAAEDRPAVYADGCWNNAPFTGRRTCTYGAATDPARQVVLLGNSHAGQWQPALVGQVDDEDWSLTTYLTSECYPVDLPIDVTVPANSARCADWTRWAVDAAIAQDPDLVVLAARTFRPLLDVPADEQRRTAQAAYARTIARFTDAGIPVLVMRDTPAAAEPVPDCIARERGGWRSCGQPQDTAVEPDPLADAATADTSGLVSVLDVTDVLCWDGVCHDVVGGAITYFDHGHMTSTFAQTLRPEVEAAVSARIRN
ncbi:acyltransferase family protein [Cellulomonas composti]|uniref:acyltransferase family protein n=1 Tax=Cellulomonas composti TaxID=266130 RepID=UPI001FE8259B|nr:acyltransferase family protein [Cellulomonas composti]